MSEFLKQVVPLLGAAIGALILFVLVREAIYSLKRLSWRRKRQRCLSLVSNVDKIEPDNLLSLATELKNAFPLDLIEGVLDEYAKTTDGKPQTTDRMLASLYSYLGFVEDHLKTLQKAKSWPERAAAAEKLGRIGHAGAVLPLIASLQDATEDREVKSVAIRALGKIRDQRAIPILIRALGIPDTTAGQLLADVLVQFGETAVDPLIEVLKSSKQEMQRFWAARILGILKMHRATGTLLSALSDHSQGVRSAAALSLGQLGAREGVPPLTKILMEDPVPRVRDAAAEALGIIADERALAALKDTLANYDYTTRRKAMEALEKMGEKAVPFFLEALSEGSKEAATQAAAALERTGVVASKIEELGGDNWEPAFELLSRIAETGVIETLASSLDNPKLEIRIRLCRILAEAANPRTLESLIDLARMDDEWVVRLEALVALVRLADIRAAPVLAHALGKEEEVVREQLLVVLQEATRALVDQLADTVISLVHDANLKVRIEAVRVLSKLHTEDIFQALLSSLSDSACEVRAEAASALGDYRQRTTDNRLQVTGALIAALQDHGREVRMAAVRSLGELEDPDAIRPLAEAFERADEGYRDDIAEALASMPMKEFYRLTDILMGLSSPKARAGIAWTLGLIGDKKATGLLATFLKDPEPVVRASAAGALGNLGKKEAASYLLDYLSDPNERVRAAVVNALGKSRTSSVIGKLLSLLESEPDVFVCQRIVLTVGCLAVCEATDHKPQTADNMMMKQIRKWLGSSSDPGSQAAGLISLALLQNESFFQDILKATRDAAMRTIMQRFLKELPRNIQDRFFAFLSLDPGLFWRNQPEKDSEHYIHLLESSREVRDRLHAIEALATLGEKTALPAIEYVFAKDPNPQVRAAALAALGKILEDERLVAKITVAIEDPSDIVRAQVLPMLNRLSPKELKGSREQLIPLLDSSQEKVRDAASELLARLYYRDWHFLADRLLGAENKTRITGLIKTLGKIGDPKATPLFVQFMKHSDPGVRATSAHAASVSGVLAKREWIPLLSDPQEAIRLAAIQGLGRQLDGEVMEIFSDHLEDPSAGIRREIATIMGKKKLAGKERPVKILRRLAQDENLEVRVLSLVSLFRMGEAGLVGEVAENLKNLERRDVEALLEYLQKEGVFVEMLAELKHGRNVANRKEAVEFLAALDLPRFASEIVHSLGDPAGSVRLAAIEALGQIEDPEIQQAIETLAQDPVEAVRKAAKHRKLTIAK